MSMSLKEHDYICSSEAKMEKIAHNQDLNLKATELRLGLPGSESPERNTINGGVGGALKNMVSGAKRGFSETVKVPSKTWGFSDNGGSDVKNGAFFSSSSSPRGENKNPSSVKETVVSSSPKHYLHNKHPQVPASNDQDSVAASKGQVVGWPPIRSFRKNSMAAKHTKNEDNPNVDSGSQCVYVKVSMDGAPYLRKVDLKIYSSYLDLSSALEKMFSSFTLGQYGTRGVPTSEGLSESPMDLLNGSEYVLTYEDKDGDLMLVGDVPWDMFTGTCKRMRIMKSSDAIGLAPRAMEKCRGRN